ncbi:ADP-sugar pyrophosphatase isoform X2 [Parasteatoda tepidariorum]|nr:ADP-sugar pyrophosphatase isoform X2 [Parasteatoda tepidariorum]XP_015903583.1 ADP-sugar pyrophosphatase isoform X2 [Parasteatoda tepidariorum]
MSKNMSENKETKPGAHHISEKVLSKGEFIALENYTYKDHEAVERTWEVATRVSKPEEGNPDCVGSLAVLRRLLKYDCLILVKQYRPALKQYTLEFPAGIVNPSEKPEETAIRELKEETGYICSSVKHVSRLTALDPGLTNSTMKVVTLEVDGDVLENHYPKQCDHDFHAIEVLHIPVNELLNRLNDFSEQGVIIDSRVYCFAIGLTVGAKNACYKQTANPY